MSSIVVPPCMRLKRMPRLPAVCNCLNSTAGPVPSSLQGTTTGGDVRVPEHWPELGTYLENLAGIISSPIRPPTSAGLFPNLRDYGSSHLSRRTVSWFCARH
jgi:hypothetical protein